MTIVFSASAAGPSATALPASAGLEICAGSGIMIGQAKELVYSASYKLSELDWPLSPAAFWSSTLNYTSAGGFRAGVALSAAFSGKSGTITDSDFLNGDGVKTHYSAHDAWLEQGFLLDARAGWRLPLPHGASLDVFGWLVAMNFKWSARDGYLQYPSETSAPYTPWSEGVPKVTVVGTGIIYQQSYVAPGILASYQFAPGKAMAASLSFGFSPLVFCNDVDNHLFRGIDFYETMSGGILFEPSLRLRWNTGPHGSLGLYSSYRLVTGLVGDTKMVYTSAQSTYPAGTTYHFTGGGGASFEAFSLALAYECRL